MSSESKQKIAILVDVQNVYYTCREAYRSNFDYNQFWYVATQGKEVVSARAYAIASNDPKQRQFHHILRGVGFEVMLKPTSSVVMAARKAIGMWVLLSMQLKLLPKLRK